MMSEKDLKRTPHYPQGGDEAWWHEQGRGIVVTVPPSNGFAEVRISWRAIRNALERKDRKS